MTQGALYINERDVEADFSLFVSGLAGFPGILGSAQRAVPLLTGPEMAGAILDPRLMVRGAVAATVTGIIMAASASAAITALDALRGLVSQGEVMVRTFYATDRYCLATLTGFDGTAHQPEVLDGTVNVTLSFLVKDGVAFRMQPDGYALTTTRIACPIGTAESRPVILVHGGGAAMTNPTITVRNASGDVVQTQVFTVSLGVNDALRIDSARCLISKVSAGTITDGMAAGYWTSGDFLLLRPYDGWIENAAYPSVELSSATGTAQGEISYRRGYV